MKFAISYDLKKINRELAGSGYQIARTATRVRIENEDGERLHYSRTIPAAIKHIRNREPGELAWTTPTLRKLDPDGAAIMVVPNFPKQLGRFTKSTQKFIRSRLGKV